MVTLTAGLSDNFKNYAYSVFKQHFLLCCMEGRGFDYKKIEQDPKRNYIIPPLGSRDF